MSEERDKETEELENWKPGDGQQGECSLDCAEESGEEVDCCACCW